MLTNNCINLSQNISTKYVAKYTHINICRSTYRTYENIQGV